VLVETSLFLSLHLSPSAHVDLIFADYFTITIDHPRVERKREREEKEHELHTQKAN
jgi:hypothetical protein